MDTLQRIENAEEELRLAKLELEQSDSVKTYLLKKFDFYGNVIVEKNSYNTNYTLTLDKYNSGGISVGLVIKEVFDEIKYIPFSFNAEGNRLIIGFLKPN